MTDDDRQSYRWGNAKGVRRPLIIVDQCGIYFILTSLVFHYCVGARLTLFYCFRFVERKENQKSTIKVQTATDRWEASIFNSQRTQIIPLIVGQCLVVICNKMSDIAFECDNRKSRQAHAM